MRKKFGLRDKITERLVNWILCYLPSREYKAYIKAVFVTGSMVLKETARTSPDQFKTMLDTAYDYHGDGSPVQADK